MHPYENLANDDISKSVEAADTILEHGWTRRRYPTIRIDGEIPWEEQPQELRSWSFLVHSWDMLDVPLKAYTHSGDLKYLRPALAVAKDWARLHAGARAMHHSSFAWYDMAVGLRALRLSFILDAGRAAELVDPDTDALLWGSLEQHASYLEADDHIMFHNNHGFYQVAGQLAMGRRFSSASKQMAKASEQGEARLRVMLHRQFTDDGVHREHSPDYHRMVYDSLKALLDVGLVHDPEILTFAARIELALFWFVMPNEYIANFGDSDYRLMSRKVWQARKKWSLPEMQYAVTAGAIGTPPREVFRAFATGGYFVVRQPSPDHPNDFADVSYLAQIAAFHSRAHKHADDLSIIWYDRGAELLVDAGRYGYLGHVATGSELWKQGYWYSDPRRLYCESTRAHNTLEFDGRDYPRKDVKPYGSALGRWLHHSSGAIVVETETKHFRRIRHVRVLAFMPRHWLLVLDWYHDNLRSPHTVRQWFHAAPRLTVREDGEGYVMTDPVVNDSVRVVPLIEGSAASRPMRGVEDPVIQGWWSPEEKKLVPNDAFCFERSDSHSGIFATLFSFSDRLSPHRSRSTCDSSLRRARLGWQDEAGTHTVQLKRPRVGSLAFDYRVE